MTRNPSAASPDRARRSPPGEPAAQIVTRDSILILSGYLIGIVAQQSWMSTMQVLTAGAAAIGLMAYVILDHVTERRRARSLRIEMERVVRRLERRIDRHVSLLRNPVERTRPHAYASALIAGAES
jgi:hypothetical protein